MNKTQRAVRQFEQSGVAKELFEIALHEGVNTMEIIGMSYSKRHKELVKKRAERIKELYPEAPFVVVDMGQMIYLIVDKVAPLSADALTTLDVTLGHMSYHRNGKLFIVEVDYLVPCALTAMRAYHECQ